MTECEWCDEEADDWGFDDVDLCDDCRAKQLLDIEAQEYLEFERLEL